MTAAPPSSRRSFVPLVAVSVIVAVAIALVALSLRQPDIPTYAPTPSPPQSGSGPVLYTVDATAPDRWQYFSLRSHAVVENPGARDWDLAFRRYQVIANGGEGFVGQGGARDLGAVAFDTVRTVPVDGYAQNQNSAEPKNPALAGWYDYGFFSHVLRPKPRVWAVRAADGRYAKLEFVGYYCPGSRPGCVTFRYEFPITAVAAGG